MKAVRPPPDLARFFDAFAPMLDQHRTPSDVEREIGASSSGTERMGFYATLARRQRELMLADTFPALRHAALTCSPPVWAELVIRYMAEHPPSHRDPNRFGEFMVEFLSTARAGGCDIPAYLDEIADFEFASWSVGVAAGEPTADDPGIDRHVVVRHYDHDVPGFVRAFHEAAVESAAPTAPAASPTAVILHRSPTTGRAQTFFPTPLGLVALARRAGTPAPLSEMPRELIDAAERDLEAHGILCTRSAQNTDQLDQSAF